jgi:hypothetical protein
MKGYRGIDGGIEGMINEGHMEDKCRGKLTDRKGDTEKDR